MGPTLEDTRRDLRYMPTQYLTQVAQSPNDRVIGDIPLKTLAGLELSRRAQMQSEMAAMSAPNAQMPTVLDSTVQSLSPQPQQPMPPQGMPPPAPPPQQAAPQPQPQQPPQPQQQQQPPQAKQPPIMGLPSMQAPKKMAGGGIIAFAEGDPVPPAEEPKIDEEEYQRLGMASMPNPRAKAAEKQAAMREAIAQRKASETKSADKVPPVAPAEQPKIQNVPNPDGGIAAFMKAFGGMGGGGGGGGGGGELAKIAKQLAASSETETPDQLAARESARQRAAELASFKAPQLSTDERRKFIDEEFNRNQAYSKPHFDMMQKLIDEERASNNAGKESEVYRMLGKMGGALMSSRGAFGPALGRAVGEGIDYNDKADAARAAAERLRRQAQMDLLKARMSDEKGDRQSALASLADHDRALKDAAKLDQEAKIASTGMLQKVADSDTKRQMQQQRLASDFQIAGIKSDATAQSNALKNQMGLMNLALRMQGADQKREVAPLEKLKIKAAVNEMFSNPFNDSDAIGYIQAVKGNRGVNLLAKIKSGELSPKDAMLDPVMAEARQIAYGDFLSGTNKSGSGGSGVQWASDFASQIGAK